jgi:hypothetical protein
MDNDARSQEKNAREWGVFLDEAKRKFADATTSEERRGLREAIHIFERLIRRGVSMPGGRRRQSRGRKSKQQHSV